MLATDMLPCEDAHAQERSLLAQVLARVVVRLDKPTRDGDAEIAILTNVPARDASAAKIAHRRLTAATRVTTMLVNFLDLLDFSRATVDRIRRNLSTPPARADEA